jgi:hypothetical protein
MRSSCGRLATLGRLGVVTLVALALATPASAQFGGLKKRLKGKAAEEGAARGVEAAGGAPAETDPGANGGTVVLTPDVVNQLLGGLKAGQAEREAAAREDTPYGGYKKAEAAYAEAKPKCEAAQQTFPQRAAGNQKMLDKYSTLTEKMVDAQSKQDYKLMQIYQDSAMAMQDPSCVVKKPEEPKDLYQAQRDIEVRAEKAEIKASGLSAGELAMAKERATAILQGGTPPGDASSSEKSAVSAKAAELKPLLGLVAQPAPKAAAVEQPAPTPAAAPAPVPQADPQMSAQASAMNSCMMKNMQEHQAELEALGKRAQAAQQANDQARILAIADTVQRIQMAGCQAR